MSFMNPFIRAFVLLLALVATGAHADAPGPERATYLVALPDAPLVVHAQQRLGAAPANAAGARNGKQAVRSLLGDAESAGYLRSLDSSRAAVIDLASKVVARPLVPSQVFRRVANGMALALSADEAAAIAKLPGVLSIRRERIEHLHTDAGPQWIGASALWNGQAAGVAATKGEGIVIGVIDTGINPTHPAFAANPADGYVFTNPRGKFLGLCASGQAACNNKLIGIYDFSDEHTSGIDSVGHGSHVSGIAAGNSVSTALNGNTQNLSRVVSGVAPHANLIMYKACNAQAINSSGDGTCAESWLVAAIDQAVSDNVDVINYSIGGGTVDPYVLLADRTSDAYAFYNARAAGVVIAVSAGNDGPGANTLDEPGNSPWVIGVANASHNRRFANALTAMSGAPGAPADLVGQSLSAGVGPAPIVYAGNYGSALCGKGSSEGVAPTGASNPFAAGTFHGEIVVCDRGIYARVEKGYNVQAAGAGGMILANAASDGASVVADDHFLPAVHVGYAQGQQLKQWLTVAGTHSGTITTATGALDDTFGDILDASSSRGPFGFGGGMLKPDVTAPGTNILSASRTGSGLAILTGTSMASPHVAGSAALVLAAHPDWDPSRVESALVGTALAGRVRMQDGVTLASPLDAGAGRAQPALAANAGLYLPVTAADYLVQTGSPNPAAAHGDLRKVNRPGIVDEHCFQSCAFVRTVADMSGGGTWQVTTTGSGGTKISVTPGEFTLAAGGAQPLSITIDVSDPRLPDTWTGGSIVLHKIAGTAASDIALTAAVHADAGTPPAFVDIQANAPSGVTTLSVAGLAQLPAATFVSTPPVLASTQTVPVAGVDLDPTSRYAAQSAAGRRFTLFRNVGFSGGFDFGTMPQAFIVEVSASDAPAMTIYAGIDSNGDGSATQAEERCTASTIAGASSIARCVVDLRNAGSADVWVLVDVTQGSQTANYSISLASGFLSIGSTIPIPTFGVSGPGHVDALATFPLRISWGPMGGYPIIDAGKRYFGAVLIAGSPTANSTALLPFAITYAGDNDDIQDALSLGGEVFNAQRAETFHNIFVDVPPGANTLKVSSSGAANVAFSAVRADSPAFSSSPHVAPAPTSAPSATWTQAGGLPGPVTNIIPVTAGRWYLIATPDAAGNFVLDFDFTYLDAPGALPPIAPGAYYNPQRSGHGIFVSQASGQQALDWYTYLEDGSPTWYQAQAALPVPAFGVWTAPLYRANWDGAKVNSRVVVGDVTLTPISASDLIFSWHLDSQSGSERFTRLGAGACPSLNGAATNFNGAWYAPTQSGYGMDVVARPDLQFAAFYFYDSLGIARWGSGAASPFAASSTINLTQNHGFCPVCDYIAVTTQPLGTLTINYASASAGTYASALVLKNPLSGAWTINQPTARLTGSSACIN